MQISTHQSPQTYKPAFCGLTNVFQKRIFEKPATYYELTDFIKDEFIGSLPPEIIKLIKNATTSQEEKVAVIKRIMATFGDVANLLKKSNIEYAEYVPHYSNYSPKAILLNIGNKIQCLKAQNLLTQVFQDTKLIGINDKIKISSFKDNAGSFGIVYNIDFPPESKISKKVLKVYKPMSKIVQRHAHHGVLPESNSAQFVAKKEHHNFKNSCFVQPYLSSGKDGFMIAEHAASYPPRNTGYKQTFDRMNIRVNDYSIYNISNNRIIDFGDITHQNLSLNKGAQKLFENLCETYHNAMKCGFTYNANAFVDLLIKYKTASQKELKINPLDARVAVNNFLANKYALSDDMLYALRRKHFMIRNNQLIQIPENKRVKF